MRGKNQLNFPNQQESIKLLEFAGILAGILAGSFGICMNFPNFYKSLDVTEKMYFLWVCELIVLALVTLYFNNRIKKTEDFCERFDNKEDKKDKEDIKDILEKMLMVQAIKVIDEMNKKESN